MSINSKSVGIVCVVVAVIAAVRLVAWTGKSETERDASRLLVCEACKSVSPLDPEMIRQSYEAGNVRVTPEGGARLKCPSCGEIAARGENLDFGGGVVSCRECEKTIIDTESGAYKAVRGGDVNLDDHGQLAFRCSRCKEFSGRMTSQNDSADEQSAPMEK